MAEKLIELKNSLQFISPDYLEMFFLVYFLIGLWVLVCLLRYWNQPKRTIGSYHLRVSRMLRFSLVMIAMVLPLSIFSLARPYLPHGAFQFKKGEIEVVFVIDDSVSMWAKDIGPKSRLETVVREVTQLYSQEVIKEGDKTALVLFGKTSLKKLRLSIDGERFFNEISRIGQPAVLFGDDHSFDSDVPLALTDVYSFLDLQDRRNTFRAKFKKNPPLDFDWQKFNWHPEKKSNRIILFFGDGDYRFSEYDPGTKERLNKALFEFRRRGLKIYSVGVGTRQGIPLVNVLRDYEKGKDYNDIVEADLKDQGFTRLDTATLNFLSSQTGGSSFTVESVFGNAAEFLRAAIEANRRSLVEVASEPGKQELWREFLFLTLFILGLAILLY